MTGGLIGEGTCPDPCTPGPEREPGEKVDGGTCSLENLDKVLETQRVSSIKRKNNGHLGDQQK